MYVPAKLGHGNPQAQHVFQMTDVAMNKVMGALVALMNEVVPHRDEFHIRIVIGDRGHVRVVFPKLSGGSADVSQELFRMCPMQIADRRRQHDDIAGAQAASQDQFARHDRMVREQWFAQNQSQPSMRPINRL